MHVDRDGLEIVQFRPKRKANLILRSYPRQLGRGIPLVGPSYNYILPAFLPFEKSCKQGEA